MTTTAEAPAFDPELSLLGVETHVASEALLWREGDVGDHVMLLLEGVLEVVHETPEGEVVLRTLEAGAVVGELATEGRTRSASVRARSACRLLKIPSSQFSALLRARPDILERLYRLQVDRVRSLTRRVARAQRRVLTDHATGLYSHAFFQERLEEEANRARRVGDSLSVALLQIDEAVLPPDCDASEGVLALVGRLARRAVRRGDLVARYGRDGCVLLLYGASSAQAARLAEAIRADAERAGREEGPSRLTVSAGVACLPEDAVEAEGLMKAVDLHLYRARDAGGNRVAGGHAAAPPVPAEEVSGENEPEDLAQAFRALAAPRRCPTLPRAFLGAVLGSLPDPVLVADGVGLVLAANPAAEALLGDGSPGLAGQPLSALFPAGWEILRGWRCEAADRLTRVLPLETTGRTRAGLTLPVELSGSVMRGPRGELLGVVCVARDVSERHRAQEELRQARLATEQASRAKSAFLANVSHELRTPLNAIIGYSEMLADELRDQAEHLVEDARRIHGSGRHLLGLVNDILAVARIEAGEVEVSWEPVGVPALVRDVVASAEPLIDKRGNRLEVRCPEDTGEIRTDAPKARQCLLNLLSNACKFTEEGQIGLEARRSSRATGDGVAFEVSDTGIGMTPEQLSRLFTPFDQAEPSATRRYGGTGLGLALTRGICNLLGGEIAVKSEAGRGTTVTLWLPAGPEQAHWPDA